MVVDAANTVKYSDGKGGFVYPIKSIRILKANGKSTRESILVKGFALNCVIAHQGIYILLIIATTLDIILIIYD